jgi:RNA polymerase sigma-70 factor (ECF subfamily)
MSDTPSTKGFVGRVNRCTDSVAVELDHRYREKLCALVQREMARSLQTREDPEDVVQTVFRTYFRRAAKGEFHIACSSDLWALLTTITRHKILKRAEYHGAFKRMRAAEAPLPQDDQILGNDPDPQDAVVVTDLVKETLQGLDDSYRDVFQLRVQGCTEAEIAKQLKTTRAAVRYRLERIRNRLERLVEKEDC